MKSLLTFLFFASTTTAQIYGPAGSSGARDYSTLKRSIQRSAASVRSTDLVFPHMATGGGWETILVIVNMSQRTVTFDQFFYDTAGRRMSVTFRSLPEGQLTTTDNAHGTLQAGQSFNIVLQDRGQPLQTGWSELDYDSTSDRLGGFSIFRQIIPGRPAFEALVPLSSIDDSRFFMPFDNLEGFVTSMALLNPGSSTTDVRLTFRSTTGSVLATRTIRLAPTAQVSFSVPQEFPEVANRTGTIYVEGSTEHLSALGFRFNTGGSFATIPIMNWDGMFPL